MCYDPGLYLGIADLSLANEFGKDQPVRRVATLLTGGARPHPG